MRKRTQCDNILAHLKREGRICSFTALRLYKCMRLAARIADLRARGYDITTIMRYEIDEDGNPVKYAVYYYEGE